jgi:rhodanese-related sulfurtransferase
VETAAAVRRWVEAGRPVVDVRTASEHLRAFVPGSQLLPFRRGLMKAQAEAMWPHGATVLMIGPNEVVCAAAEQELATAGVAIGGMYWGPIGDLQAEGLALRQIDEWDVPRLADALAGPAAPGVLDVRERHEWQAAHIAGAVFAPLGELADRMADLDRDRPWAVICASGVRSARAAVALDHAGFCRVANVRGGMNDWLRLGMPVERG